MLNKINIVLYFLLLSLLVFPEVAIAEGGCPPGSYPIGGQGVQGCAPIPSIGGGTEGPRATGRWQKTWGAIAMSKSGQSGVATDRVKKVDAVRDAIAECVSTGAKDCKVVFTYKNQCAAAATSKNGVSGTTFGRAANIPVAENIALDFCVSRGGEGCEIVYSACTEPEFKPY
ncbi:MAG: DUF4189 domain-containing protein [Stenotrophomonas sp.]